MRQEGGGASNGNVRDGEAKESWRKRERERGRGDGIGRPKMQNIKGCKRKESEKYMPRFREAGIIKETSDVNKQFGSMQFDTM